MEARNDTETKNVLLLYPRTPDTYWSYRHAISFLGKKALMPPLGLLTVAGIMGDAYSYRLVDLNVRELQEADLEWADRIRPRVMMQSRESITSSSARVNAPSLPSAPTSSVARRRRCIAPNHQSAPISPPSPFPAFIGFDSDPPDVGERQIRFVRHLAIPTAMVGLLIALPNTRLWDRLTREGRILSRTNGNNTHGVELNVEPRTPREILVREYARVLHSIYNPQSYFARCLKLLARIPRRSCGPGAGRLRGISRDQVRALVQSVVRQGLLSRYALWYWSFMARAVVRRPRQIVRIVTMAVLGHHYFRITEQLPRPRSLRYRSVDRVTQPSPRGKRLVSTG